MIFFCLSVSAMACFIGDEYEQFEDLCRIS